MLIEKIETAALNQPTQLLTTSTTVAAANADRLNAFDVVWSPIWNILPWQQLATVIGLGWILYSIAITVKDRREK